jgi:hypothetical protein
LRLVQENPERKVSGENENKRSSWMGWAFGKKDETSMPSEESIQE